MKHVASIDEDGQKFPLITMRKLTGKKTQCVDHFYIMFNTP